MPAPFELRLALFGHGWVDLAPNRWDEDAHALATVLTLGRQAVDVRLEQRGARLELRTESRSPLGPAARQKLVSTVARMVRLDEDFAHFYALCRRQPGFAWVARRGGGRLLRASSWFEDLAKLLLTTNCSWSQTRAMVARLCEALGRTAPSKAHAFPEPRAVAEVSERYLTTEIRVGYRARALLELAERLARPGAARSLSRAALTADGLREELSSLHGFGPYAVGQALRLAGHYGDYALDSWCKNKLSERGLGATERALARRYKGFGEYRGLALWMELTAPWHGEGPFAREGQTPLLAE